MTKRDPNSRHYDHGGIETLDVIRAKLTPEQYEGYLLGNIIKYSCRANFKDDFYRDNEKIGFYQRFLAETMPHAPTGLDDLTVLAQAPEGSPEARRRK